MAAALGYDPHAGEWRHEIVRRTVYTLVCAALLAGIVAVLERALRGTSYGDYIYPPLCGLFFALPESLLRRSLKMGLMATAIAIVAAVVGFQIPKLFAVANSSERLQVKLLVLCLGGALGLSAGIGARSFLAAILGLLLGHGGGFLSYYLWHELDNLETRLGPLHNFVAILLMVLPLSLASGLAVCLGVRLSRRGASPDTPVPPV